MAQRYRTRFSDPLRERTTTDLAGSDKIHHPHLAKTIQYRPLDQREI